MGFVIEDGKGTSKKVGVSDGNRLLVESVSGTVEHTANTEGNAYHMLFQQTPSSSNTCFVYIENNSDTSITIEGLYLRLGGTSQTEQIEVKLKVTGTPSGTDTTPVNCNTGSGAEADGVFVTGNNITGLSSGEIVERWYIESSNTSVIFNFEQDIIIQKNTSIALYAVSGSNEIDGTIVFHYHN